METGRFAGVFRKMEDGMSNPLFKDRNCTHPARSGVHEEYGRPDGSSFCRACGEELDPPQSSYHGHLTLKDGSHVPLTGQEAKALFEAAEEGDRKRAEMMPTSEDAMRLGLGVQQRMKALGWRKGMGLKMRAGDDVAVREDGSTGIWSGWIETDSLFVHYCDSVADPRRVWLKPVSELTEDEREQMAVCDKDAAEWIERQCEIFSQLDTAEEE